MIAREAVDLSVPCREYPSKDREYPRRRFRGRLTRVHRIAFLTEKGPLGPDETVDHLCFNKHCWEPLHLEAVSLGENTRRAWVAGRQTRPHADQPGSGRCYRGHEPHWSRNGQRGWVCLTCHNEHQKAYLARRADVAVTRGSYIQGIGDTERRGSQ